jgi:hypothetical protein
MKKSASMALNQNTICPLPKFSCKSFGLALAGRDMRPDARPTIADPDNDPFLWLDEIEGEHARA